MKTNSIATKTVVSAGFALCIGLATGNPAQAQSLGTRRVFRPLPSRSATASTGSLLNGQTATGQTGVGTGVIGGGASGGGPGGNQGGGQQTPLAVGTIVAGDASTGRILIQSQSNNNQVLQVSNSTRFVTQTAITTSDLETGEWVQVQGVASTTTGAASITAASITAGQIPSFMQQNNRPSGMGGNPPGRANATQTTAATQASSTVTLTGLITSISPLVVKLHSGVSITVKTATNAQINRVTPLLFSQLQVGEQLKATGTNTSNGGFVLTEVAIDM